MGASDPRILRIVATVDAMTTRGQADAFVEPLRRRLSTLRPPRPLRFARLLFHPLDPLIVPAKNWQPGEISIPRTALTAMADHVLQAMGDNAHAIEAEISGHTNADTELITRLGRSLWPVAARILRTDSVPQTWQTSGLGAMIYRPLADCIATLLDQASSLEALCAEAASGLVAARPEAIAAMVDDVATTNPAALPMFIALLLTRYPESAASVPYAAVGANSTAVRAAMDQATDRVLRQLDDEAGIEGLLASGTLAGAGATAARVNILLAELDKGASKPRRREQVRSIRRRLDASCIARFAMALEEELLTPLQHLDDSADPPDIRGLEAAARNLRALELTARAVGSGATYDFLLRKATDVIKARAACDRLAIVDQIRLVEVLSGPDAALAMLDSLR